MAEAGFQYKGAYRAARDLRVSAAPDPDQRHEVTRCVVCDHATSGGKPWCKKHVLTHSPYVKSLGVEA